MNLWHLIRSEIRHRWINFAASALMVGFAVGGVVAALDRLARFDCRTRVELAAQEAGLRERMASLEDDYRKITKGLGFNVLILPEKQNLADFYAEDYASKTMPEEYAIRLAKAGVATINHVLPILQQKTNWPEQKRTVQLTGTRGEISLSGKGKKDPLLDPVPARQVAVGFELHRSLNLAVGDEIAFQGRKFKVSKLQPQRGNQDDITLWINLAEAQQLLNKPGVINGILALECNCAADRLSQIRAEIASVLPDTQVIEFSGQALARAEARNRAALEAKESLMRWKDDRGREREARESFLAVQTVLILGVAAVSLGLLTLFNLKRRTAEIGILRAIGLGTRRVLVLVLSRAAAIGVLGAAFGFCLGWLVSWLADSTVSDGPPLGALFDPSVLGLAIALSPAFAVLVSWLPAYWATQIDPAKSLRER